MKHEVTKQELLHKGRKISFFLEDHLLPNGNVSSYDIVRHPGAVVILPCADDGRLFLIRQFRPAIDDYLLEFPAGTIEAGEDPFPCAKREIEEEIGMEARDWTELGTIYPTPGFCDEIQHCYFAKGLSPKVRPQDEDEIIELCVLTPAELKLAVHEGKLQDCKSMAILLRAWARGLVQL